MVIKQKMKNWITVGIFVNSVHLSSITLLFTSQPCEGSAAIAGTNQQIVNNDK